MQLDHYVSTPIAYTATGHCYTTLLIYCQSLNTKNI